MKLEIEGGDQNKQMVLSKLLHVIVLICVVFPKQKIKKMLFKILKQCLEAIYKLTQKNRKLRDWVLEALIENELFKREFPNKIFSKLIDKLNKNCDKQKDFFSQNMKHLCDSKNGRRIKNINRRRTRGSSNVRIC